MFKKNHLTPLKHFQNLLFSPKMCNISIRGRLGNVMKEHSHIYLQKMKYYLCKQPIRYTELSIKVDLLDANCGGAFNDIVGQLVTIVTRQFSQ